jgi:hypothetical protein
MATDTKTVVIDYTNWHGKRGNKRIRPTGIAFMSNEYHPNPCWMLLAVDLDIMDDRTYPFKNIHSWGEIE